MVQILSVPQIQHIKSHLPFKSPKNTLYFALSLSSSSTTSNRLPVKLFAATTAVHNRTNIEESAHLIVAVV
jgi:hypothetical protein